MIVDPEKKKLIAGIALLLAVIWSIVFLLTVLGAFNGISSADSAIVLLRIISCITPIMISSLALIPLLNEDMPIVSYISIVLSIILLVITLFTDGLDSNILSNIIAIDFLVLIVCTVRTSSSIHKIFKYGMFVLIAITVFVLNMDLESGFGALLGFGMLGLEETSSINLPAILTVFTIMGFLINPCIAAITDDGSFVGFGGGYDDNHANRTPKYDRSESPLEMYNRLVKEQQTNGGGGTQPAAEPAPTAGSQIGPNSGAVINPLAMVQKQEPAPTPAPAPVAEQQTTNENFEVPESMSFLFDNNQDKSN